MPEESAAAGLVGTKTRATDFSIAAIMARGAAGAAGRKQQQACRTALQSSPALSAPDGKLSKPHYKHYLVSGLIHE